MGYTIPDAANAAYAYQAGMDSVDLTIITAGMSRNGVQSGGTVTWSSGMQLAVAAGVAQIASQHVAFSAATPTVTAADPSNPRFDLVCVNTSAVVSMATGTAASFPTFPSIPSNSIVLASVYVPAAASALSANALIDKRVMLSAINVYNVSDFGATGNGTTDDKTAIQNTINAAQNAGGGEVFFPAGTYLISDTLTISADNIVLRGASWAAQVLASATWTSGHYMLVVQAPSGAYNFRYGFRAYDLFFNGQNTAGVNGLDLQSVYASVVQNIRIRYVVGTNILYDGATNQFGAYNYLINCQITDGGAAAVGVATNDSEWLTIIGCNFGYFNGGTGVCVFLKNLNCRVIGTSFDNNDIAVHCQYAGRNLIANCQFDRGYTNFIFLDDTVDTLVTGNVFCGYYGGATGTLIAVGGSSNAGNIITGNTCSYDASYLWMNFVNEAAGTGGTGGAANLYSHNAIQNYAVVRQTGIFRSNMTYNPVGHLTSPGIPSSTTPYTNAFGVDCTVCVSGGTVTAIAIGGTATGLTSGAFRVPANQTITLTYSAAPTWVWFGD